MSQTPESEDRSRDLFNVAMDAYDQYRDHNKKRIIDRVVIGGLAIMGGAVPELRLGATGAGLIVLGTEIYQWNKMREAAQTMQDAKTALEQTPEE